MRFLKWALPLFLFSFLGTTFLYADDSVSVDTPTPQATLAPPKASSRPNASKALTIHKPMLSPSWGKVIQYTRQEIPAAYGKEKETVYEFVMQDENGIIRVATFHENESGDGYWEVTVWDQP